MITTTHPLLVIAASLSLVAALLFCILYSRVRWWRTPTGISVMALAACLVVLPLGTLTRHLGGWGTALLTPGYLLVTATLVWRTVIMWHTNHDNKEK